MASWAPTLSCAALGHRPLLGRTGASDSLLCRTVGRPAVSCAALRHPTLSGDPTAASPTLSGEPIAATTLPRGPTAASDPAR
jgi:hypothetical protein